MARVLLIDEDRPFVAGVGLACLERGIGVAIAENVSEGIRLLLDGRVSAVLVDSTLLRLPAADQARLFEAVAPGVPVVVLVSEQVSAAARARYEVLGFHVLSKPFAAEDLAARVETLTGPATIRHDDASKE